MATGRNAHGWSVHLEQARGDKTAIELFLAGIAGWETGLRRQFDSQPKSH